MQVASNGATTTTTTKTKANNMGRGTKFKQKSLSHNRLRSENNNNDNNIRRGKIGRQQQASQSSLGIFSLAQEIANNVPEEAPTKRDGLEANQPAEEQQKLQFSVLSSASGLSADELGDDFAPSKSCLSSENCNSTSEIAQMDDLFGSESRVDSLRTLPRGRHLRRLLARSGLFLSSVVPPQPASFSEQLVLERPQASFSDPRVGPIEDGQAYRLGRVPRIMTTIPIPRQRPVDGQLAVLRRPARANLLLVQPHLELNNKQSPLPVLLIRRPPMGFEEDPGPPAGMFDDEEDSAANEPTSNGNNGANKNENENNGDNTERQLDHIDQLIKAEFETRLSLNEHIVRDPNQFRAPLSSSGQLNATPVVTLNGYSEPTPATTAGATNSPPVSGETTTVEPNWPAQNSLDKFQQFTRHSNRARSVQVGFRPVQPVVLQKESAAPRPDSERDRPLETANERKSAGSSFVPTDLETIAQLKQKTASEQADSRARTSRDKNATNSTSSLLWPANRIRAAQSSPPSSVSQSGLMQQQRQSNELNPFIGSKQTGLSLKESFMEQPGSNRRPATFAPDQPQHRQRLNAGTVGLASADTANIQHQMNANQNFRHQIEEQHSMSALNETLRRLRETKARIRQLQSELNATDPLLLLLEPQPGQRLRPNTSGRPPQPMVDFVARENRAKVYSPRLQTSTTKADMADSWPDQQHLALSGGSPVRAQPPPPFNNYPSMNPLTAPARLMVSAFGRAAQSAIATQRMPGDFASWPSISSAAATSTTGRLPLPPGGYTTSAPIILSSTMSVLAHSSTAPTTSTDSSQPTSPNGNPFDGSQLARPVDLSALTVTTPAASISDNGYNNNRPAADHPMVATTKVTNKEQQGNNLQMIGPSSSQTNRTVLVDAASSSTEPQTSESVDSRTDTQVNRLPAGEHAKEPYQFRYQERPRAAATAAATTAKTSSDKAANKREEQSSNDLPARPADNNRNHHHSKFRDSSEPTNKPLINDTIDRMSAGNDATDRQFVADDDGGDKRNQTSPIRAGQSWREFLEQPARYLAKLFGWPSVGRIVSQEPSNNSARTTTTTTTRPAKPTTERVLLMLIAFICSMALACALAAFAAVRYQTRKAAAKSLELTPAPTKQEHSPTSAGTTLARLDWRKLVSAGSQDSDRFRREKLILDGTMRNVSLLARQHHQTGAKRQVERKRNQLQAERQQQQQQLNNLPAPMFKQSCCHCVACSESWLFRADDDNGRRRSDRQQQQQQQPCSSGFYHPAPRGKLPFGAASSVNRLLGVVEPDRATSAKSREASSASETAAAAAATNTTTTAAPLGRIPIGGTRLRMMSAIDERQRRRRQLDQHDRECSCEAQQRRLPIVAGDCFQGGHDERCHHEGVCSDANAGPEEDNDQGRLSAATAKTRPTNQRDDDDADDDGDLCNCCYGDRNVNLSDSFNDTPTPLRLLDRESLGGFSGGGGGGNGESADCGQRNKLPLSRTGGQVDSINIISRGKANPTTKTSAKTAANCESGAAAAAAGDNNNNNSNSNNKCSSKFRAKISASNRLEPAGESENELDDDDGGAVAGCEDAHLRGAKGVLSSQLPSAIRQQQLDCNHGQQQQQQQRCFKASALSVECLHEANHSAAGESARNQAGEHQSALTATSRQPDKLKKYKLMDEQHWRKQRQQQQQARGKVG